MSKPQMIHQILKPYRRKTTHNITVVNVVCFSDTTSQQSNDLPANTTNTQTAQKQVLKYTNIQNSTTNNHIHKTKQTTNTNIKYYTT